MLLRCLGFVSSSSVLSVFSVVSVVPAAPEQLDPAAWGSDHVGKPVPEYVTGDECLFCHRDDVGPTLGRATATT